MHGEHLIELRGTEEVVVGLDQLHAEGAGFDARDQQEDEGGHAVKHGDPLMIDRSHPAPDAGVASWS